MIKFVKKLWGSEEWLVNTEMYCAKYLNLLKGFQCSLHYHRIKDETFYVMFGEVEVEIAISLGDSKDVASQSMTMPIRYKQGESIRVKPRVIHRFKALTDTVKLLEVSTHHEDKDSYRIEKSRATE